MENLYYIFNLKRIIICWGRGVAVLGRGVAVLGRAVAAAGEGRSLSFLHFLALKKPVTPNNINNRSAFALSVITYIPFLVALSSRLHKVKRPYQKR